MHSEDQIRSLLEAFQEGYRHRDQGRLDAFMGLFLDSIEIIGTAGYKPGESEWHRSLEGARSLFADDWEGWGDLELDLEALRITVEGSAGWISVPATLTTHIGEENYQSYLETVRHAIDRSDLCAKQKLHEILRGGTNTVFELERGEEFIWPLRIVAVVVKTDAGWKFAQICFSYPTTRFPDVRIFRQ